MCVSAFSIFLVLFELYIRIPNLTRFRVTLFHLDPNVVIHINYLEKWTARGFEIWRGINFLLVDTIQILPQNIKCYLALSN